MYTVSVAALKGTSVGALVEFASGAFTGVASGGMDSGMKYIKNPKGFCFVAGTLVLTCLGFASIETIRPGDYVYSRNMATGAIEEQAVLEVYEREVYETYSITIGDEEIEATAEHPFYTLNDGWVAAEDLEIGDEVATADGESETVDDIVRNILDEPVTVYNFAVMDNHNYFVGENRLLVHNSCVKNPKVSETKLEKAIEKHADALKSNSDEFLYHSCGDSVADTIAENGFRTDLPDKVAAFQNNRYGRGVYLADSPATALAERPGGTILKVKAKLGKNLNVTNRGIIGGDDYSMTHAIARGARKHGYDSITFMSAKRAKGVNTVVFNPANVVVEEIMR